jgi:2'-aminobiphenyl-2,3-diol 1,2-dioxygenase large subunit
MAQIVGAYGVSHVLMDPEGTEGRGERVIAGMKKVGQMVQAAEPDLIVMISGDHMFNINMAMQVPLCVGVADTWTPFGEMGIDRSPFSGHRDFAMHLATKASASGFDMAQAEELEPDHGIMIPLMFADPDRKRAVVPVLININMTPLPSPERCYRLGKVIRDAVDSFPSAERVAVIGTGGLSHWIFLPQMGEVAEEFDRQLLRDFAEGRAQDLATLSADEIVDRSGNGGIEIVNWLVAAAAVNGNGGTEVFYEPVPEWLTGMGGVAFTA